MKNLTFEKVSQLLVVAAKGDCELYRELFSVPSEFLELDFVEYVKSQLQLDLVSELYSRDIGCYFNTYKFLEGDGLYAADAKKVLRYFYSDMMWFLIRNPNNVVMQITAEHFSETLTGEGVDTVQLLLNSKESGELPRILERWDVSFLVDNMLNLQDLLVKEDSYSLAVRLAKQLRVESERGMRSD